jgi:predicted protein tyrosine phosphatase
VDIEITSLSRARRIKRRGFDAVITLENHDDASSRRLRFHNHPAPAHLILVFTDLDMPMPGLPAATPNQVQSALDFARDKERLLVHCFAGLGRSTAIAYAILADRLGPGREKEALAQVYALRPEASPSLMTVRAAELALQRPGKLEAALLAAEAENPQAATFRAIKRNFWAREAARMNASGGVLRPNDEIVCVRLTPES